MRKIDISNGRECSQCHAFKPIDQFQWKLRGKRVTPRCHDCRKSNYKQDPHVARARAREYYWANRTTVRVRAIERRRTNTANELLKAAKARAKKHGIAFDLTIADVVVPAICPVLGIPLVVHDGVCQFDSPTLDRIVPQRGYVRGNVAVISLRANTIKSDATIAELQAVTRYCAGALAIAVTYAETQQAKEQAA